MYAESGNVAEDKMPMRHRIEQFLASHYSYEHAETTTNVGLLTESELEQLRHSINWDKLRKRLPTPLHVTATLWEPCRAVRLPGLANADG